MRDARAFELRHVNVACRACPTGLHMVLVAVDPMTREATHTEGVLVACGCTTLTRAAEGDVERTAVRVFNARPRGA